MKWQEFTCFLSFEEDGFNRERRQSRRERERWVRGKVQARRNEGFGNGYFQQRVDEAGEGVEGKYLYLHAHCTTPLIPQNLLSTLMYFFSCLLKQKRKEPLLLQ